MTERPLLGARNDEADEAAQAFASGLQAGHDQRDADLLNRQFAADVLWGSPYGALIRGFEELHPIHLRFQRQAGDTPRIRYQVRSSVTISEDVVVTHIARLVLDPDGVPLPPSAAPEQPFSELAMYVLVRRAGRWWLAAGQHTPIRPGGAVTAVT